MTDDPLKRCQQLLTQAIEELRAVQIAVPRPEAQRQDNRPKLSPRDVQAIHDLSRRGLSVSEIADVYDVHHATISRTLRGVYHKRGRHA